MPYNTRSVTRKKNAAKKELNHSYFTRSKVPKFDNQEEENQEEENQEEENQEEENQEDDNKKRFNITCASYIKEVNEEKVINKQIEIFNNLIEFIKANKRIYDLPEYWEFREVTIKKIIVMYHNATIPHNLSNNWHIWLTGRPIV
jgi:hypothetical protein